MTSSTSMTGPTELLRRGQIALLRESLDRTPGDRIAASALVTAATLVDHLRLLVDHLGEPEMQGAADRLLREALELWTATRTEGTNKVDDTLQRAIDSALGVLR